MKTRAFTLVELPEVSDAKRAAFTLVELLVVVAIIVVLIAILVPSLERAVYQAQVAKCAAHFRNLSLSCIQYGQDNQAAFPNFPVSSGIGLNVWGVGRPLYIKFAEYGAGWQTWFCAVQTPGQSWTGRDEVFNIPASVIASRDNKVIRDHMASFFPQYELALGQMMYWVPRTSGSQYCPHDGTNQKGNRNLSTANEWPLRLTQLGDKRHPLMSDLLYINYGEDPQPFDINFIRGTHRLGQQIDSTNAAYSDGAVILRFRDQFELRQDANYGNWY